MKIPKKYISSGQTDGRVKLSRVEFHVISIRRRSFEVAVLIFISIVSSASRLLVNCERIDKQEVGLSSVPFSRNTQHATTNLSNNDSEHGMMSGCTVEAEKQQVTLKEAKS